MAAAAAPDLRLIEPTENDTYAPGEEVVVIFRVLDFVFVDYKNNRERYPANEASGHVRYWIDSDSTEIESGRKVLSDEPVSLGILPEGEYTLVIEAVRNDNSRFDPPVRAISTVKVGKLDAAGLRSLEEMTAVMWQVIPGLLVVLIGLVVLRFVIARRRIPEKKE